jgi:hypothetical protein
MLIEIARGMIVNVYTPRPTASYPSPLSYVTVRDIDPVAGGEFQFVCDNSSEFFRMLESANVFTLSFSVRPQRRDGKQTFSLLRYSFRPVPIKPYVSELDSVFSTTDEGDS